jgi:hypothetical protein
MYHSRVWNFEEINLLAQHRSVYYPCISSLSIDHDLAQKYPFYCNSRARMKKFFFITRNNMIKCTQHLSIMVYIQHSSDVLVSMLQLARNTTSFFYIFAIHFQVYSHLDRKFNINISLNLRHTAKQHKFLYISHTLARTFVLFLFIYFFFCEISKANNSCRTLCLRFRKIKTYVNV